MAADQYEHQVGYELRDRYGRRQFVVKTQHAALASTDIPGSDAVYDADGREQIVLTGAIAGSTYYQTVQDEGVSMTQRAIIDFQGAGVTVSDNGTKTIVTIPGGGGGGSGYATIQEEGTPVTAQTTLNFVGSLITAANDGPNSRTNVTVAADSSKTDKSTLTAKGDIYVATASSTPARLAVGTDGQVLAAASGQSTGLQWITLATRESPTFTYPGTVATGTLAGYFTSIPANRTKKLLKARYRTTSGTVAFKVQINGVDATGFTGLSATSTAATTDPTDITLAEDDEITVVITSTTSGVDFRCSLIIEESV